MHRDAHHQAFKETQGATALKHLSYEQKSAAENLIRNLVTFEQFRNDEEFAGEALTHLTTSVLALREAIEKNVPRDVLLAILDRDSLNPKPVQGVLHGGGG